jgi:hypothetical protein
MYHHNLRRASNFFPRYPYVGLISVVFISARIRRSIGFEKLKVLERRNNVALPSIESL